MSSVLDSSSGSFSNSGMKQTIRGESGDENAKKKTGYRLLKMMEIVVAVGIICSCCSSTSGGRWWW